MCTRVFLAAGDTVRVAGRTLDFSGTSDPRLHWLPAGRAVAGGTIPGAATWTSRHDSLVITDFDGGCVDGMNRPGLAAHALMFTSAEYEPGNGRPALGTAAWVPFVLDNCTTVAEALEALMQVRVVPDKVLGVEIGVHLVLEDAGGDSAVIEPIDGCLTVHHSPQYRVAANSPSLTEQLANRERYRPFGGQLPPPGDITSLDRFVRASYFLHYVPDPADGRQAAIDVMQVLATVAKPAGVPYPDGDVYPTRWLSAVDLTGRTYYFWSRTSPSLLWIEMDALDGVQGPVEVRLSDPDLRGDIRRAMTRDG